MKKLFTTFLFSLVLVFVATTNFTSANDAEDQTASVIVSDTNAASITSPMPDETVTSTVPETQSATSPANEWTFTDSFESRNLGDLNGQGGWAVTNYNEDDNNTVNVSTANPAAGTKSVEITNTDSIIVTRDITPINAGVFQFRMRHNKSGLFYFYALTSDVGGQLLFSIQFTESNGILLEETNKQITLLPDYNADQWYLFTIDFDNKRGEKGAFQIKIDDGNYSEYEYVNSESALFDFAQMVFGSESNGTAISAFGEITSVTPIISTLTVPIDDTATSTITTVDIDGLSIVTSSTDTSTDIPTTETTNADQLANVISALDDTVSATSDNASVTTSTEEPTATIIVSDTNAPSLTSPLSNEMTTSIVPEETPTTSSVTGDTNTNGTTTTTF